MFSVLKRILAFVIAIIEVILILRFVLKILAANAQAPLVNGLYALSQPFIQPFSFIFPTPSMKGGYVIEFTTLFAIFAYAFGEYIVQQFLSLFLQIPRSDESQKGA